MRHKLLFTVFAVATLALAACQPAGNAPTTGSTGPSTGTGAAKPTVRIGSTNFSEQLLLAELYGGVLEANGYTIERRLNLGNREIVAPAIESGQVDLVAEYLATYLEYLNKNAGKASTDPAATQKELQTVLTPKNLTVLDFAQAVDTNGFVVTKETAQKYGLTKVSDLSKANGQLVLGGPAECPDRPFCLKGLQTTYGLRFKEFKSLDAGGPLTVAALEGKQIDVALLFTSDAVINVKGLVLLEDDKKLQLADNVAPVVRSQVLTAGGDEMKRLLNSVSAKLTTAELTKLNKAVGVDKADAKKTATDWLKAQGLIK